jgi:hypothetical protein
MGVDMKGRIGVNLIGCVFVAIGLFLVLTHKHVAGAVLASGGLVAIAVVVASPSPNLVSSANE